MKAWRVIFEGVGRVSYAAGGRCREVPVGKLTLASVLGLTSP
jgi:hypothetical protein